MLVPRPFPCTELLVILFRVAGPEGLVNEKPRHVQAADKLTDDTYYAWHSLNLTPFMQWALDAR